MSEAHSDFRSAHYGPVPLLLPNAWDFASAAALSAAGYAAIGTTSLGVAASHGLPDGTGATKDQTLALARSLTKLPTPITVDIEAGFSDDPGQVADFVAALAACGVAGINIEDGRPDGLLADPGLQVDKITAIKCTSPDLFVNARTDPFWLAIPDPLPVALSRAGQYRQAGADGVFVPGATAASDISALVAGIDAPVNILFSPAHLPVAELAGLGVSRISTGSLLFRAVFGAAADVMTAIRDGQAIAGDVPSYQQIQRLTG